MIRIAAWALDMSDAVLTRLVQLGVDCADGMDIPTDDRGVYDLEQAIAIKNHMSVSHFTGVVTGCRNFT